MRLEKYHGLGNDFLVLADLSDEHPMSAAAVRALCDRHRGVGADGFLRLLSGRDGCDVTMELYNADGGRAEMSGNGIRCLGRAAIDLGLVAGPQLAVATDAGRRMVTLLPDGQVSAEMGSAEVGPALPELLAGWEGRRVDVGNPHLVLLGSDPDGVPVEDLGPKLEAREPEGLNVEFVTSGPALDALTMRVWERGVGETQACGTGSCAAVAAARVAGVGSDRMVVHQPGGAVQVELTPSGIVLTGPAERICTVDVPCP